MSKLLHLFAFSIFLIIWFTLGLYFWILLMVTVTIWVSYLALINITKRPYGNMPSHNNILSYTQTFWLKFLKEAKCSFFENYSVSNFNQKADNEPIPKLAIKIIFAFATLSFILLVYYLISIIWF